MQLACKTYRPMHGQNHLEQLTVLVGSTINVTTVKGFCTMIQPVQVLTGPCFPCRLPVRSRRPPWTVLCNDYPAARDPPKPGRFIYLSVLLLLSEQLGPPKCLGGSIEFFKLLWYMACPVFMHQLHAYTASWNHRCWSLA